MFKDKMVNKIFNGIIDKMCTLVNENGQWTSKLSKNVFVQKLNIHNNGIGMECLCFHQLC
jgi:hypothetical protein